MAQTNLVIQNMKGRPTYLRNYSPSRDNVQELLSSFYDAKAIVVPSGITAIAVAIQAILLENKWSCNFVIGKELYCETPHVFKYLAQNFAVGNIKVFDPQYDDVDKILTMAPTILFIESCSNPSGFIFPFDQIASLKRKYPKLYVVVDNTWLTHVSFNPFKYGADMTVISMTKHYSDGQCIAGAVMARNKLAASTQQYCKTFGLHVSPAHTDIIRDYLTTQSMKQHMEQAYQTSLKVAKHLEKHDKVLRVLHPGLPNHPSHQRFQQYITPGSGPTVFIFKVTLKKPDACRWLRNNAAIIPHITSFGGPHSKTDPWPIGDHDGTWCRLSIGWDEPAATIISKLNKMLINA